MDAVAVAPPEVLPARRRPGWLGPVAVAAAGAAGCAYLVTADPSDGGAFVPCPFHALTGLWCPGCGTTRALHRLVTGDPLGALGMNLLLPVTLVLVGWAWLHWLLVAIDRPRLASPARLPTALWWVMLAVVAVFGVARNLPVEPLAALAP